MEINIKVKDRTPELFQKVEAAMEQFIKVGSTHIRNDLERRLNLQGTGAVYKRGSVIHQASAPGHSPVNDSSNLTGSIDAIMVNSLEAKIGTPVAYAPLLESGTSRMEARPLWEVTAKESLPTLENLLRSKMKKL